MKPNRRYGQLFVVIIAALFAVNSYTQVPVGTPFLLQDRVSGGIVPNKMIEPSGVVAIGDSGFLLVANDKDDGNGLSLIVVEAKTGTIIKLLENIQGNKKNPKWEAMAKDSDCYYYAIGSHSVDLGDSAEKLATRSRLFRFRLKGEAASDPMAVSMDLGVKEFDIKTSLTKLGIYDADPAKNKSKIEGMAIRTVKGQKQLVIGLREPFDSTNKVQIYYAELTPESQTTSLTALTLKPFFQFFANRPKDSPEPFKLSSIDYIENLKGFLVLTSTEGAGNAFYGNAMWFVSDADIEKSRNANTKDIDYPVTARQIWDFPHDLNDKNYVEMKAEGLSLLPTTVGGMMRLVIVYDNDPQSTHADGKLHPSKMECLEMSGDFKIARVGC
jgi:hypothetical protein